MKEYGRKVVKPEWAIRMVVEPVTFKQKLRKFWFNFVRDVQMILLLAGVILCYLYVFSRLIH